MADLGEAYSPQTDGERAHLHLGVYRSKEINLRGYVETEAELERWIDPFRVLDASNEDLAILKTPDYPAATSIPVLVYHHIRPQEGWSKATWSWKMTVAPPMFDEHMRWL